MDFTFSLSQFTKSFPDELSCFEEIKRLRFPHGIKCIVCRKITIHYKLNSRASYSCKICRHQVYPLTNTIFEKSSTPLRVWFYGLFLMTHTRSDMKVIQLQKELKVTYKTAWRMYKKIRILMEQNKADLLSDEEKGNILHWTLFNTLEIKITQRKEKL